MGPFGKRRHQEPAPVDGQAAPTTNTTTTASHSRGGFFSRNRGTRADKHHGGPQYSMSSRPTFGQWLKHTVLDIVTMAVMGAIGLGVYFAEPAPSRSFPVRFSDGEIVYPEIAYPLRDEIIPIWAAAMLAVFVPIVVILFMQIRIRSFWDVNNGVIGLLYSLITAAVFQVFIKWLIGGLRPHFLDVCKPDITRAQGGYNDAGFDGIYYTKAICTGDMNQINDALESMPSGHTTAAFAGFVYLYLYLNAKLKVFSNYHPAMWKLIALYAPLLAACLIGGALTIDEYHNWYDVLAGAIIGTIMAFSSYRMVYAAIWDWRFNHIPLHRGSAFSFGGSHDFHKALWTRKAGWGAAAAAAGALGHEKHGHGHSHGMHGSTGTHGAHGMHGTTGARGTHGAHHNGVYPEGPGYTNEGYAHDGGIGGGVPRRPVGGATHGDNIV